MHRRLAGSRACVLVRGSAAACDAQPPVGTAAAAIRPVATLISVRAHAPGGYDSLMIGSERFPQPGSLAAKTET